MLLSTGSLFGLQAKVCLMSSFFSVEVVSGAFECSLTFWALGSILGSLHKSELQKYSLGSKSSLLDQLTVVL